MLSSRARPNLYGGKNPVEVPAYTMGDAARYLHVPLATVRAWILGRKYPTASGVQRAEPIVAIADPRRRLLSFLDLAELHVLSSVRREHRLKFNAIRRAVRSLRKHLGNPHPLSSRQMLTDGQDLFLVEFGRLVNVSKDGQLEMKLLLDAYLRRIERDGKGLPIRLYPLTREQVEESPQSIVIDPTLQFGRPCLAGTGIGTGIVMERYLAGESIQALAKDYGRPVHQVEEALRFEAVHRVSA